MPLTELHPIALRIGLTADWTPGCPPWVDPESHAIDVQMARESECGNCGQYGLQCHPFWSAPCEPCPQRKQYLCFAICPWCGGIEEY
jgi:hypothetical protein